MRLFRIACIALLLSVAARPALVEEGRFLVIGDIHFDPFYDGSLFGQLRDAPVDQWAEVLKNSQPAGINPRGTDSNYALLASSLDAARAQIPDPDFVLYPGDFLAHEWQSKYDRLAPKSHTEDVEAYRAFTTKVVQFLALEFRHRFPETPILPTLGNDDSFCGDYAIGPDGPFLAMFANAWQALLGKAADTAAFCETFARGGYYTLPLPGTPGRRLVVINSVYFSVNYDDACASSTATPALDQFRWLDQTIDRAQASGERVWLLMHIPPGINSFNTAEALSRGEAVETFWQPELTRLFLRLIDEHPGTIEVIFTGHTHMDDFRVVGQPGGDRVFCKIAPAVSPIFGNNPGFQIYRHDRREGGLVDYETHFLNLSQPGAPWAREYGFQDAYGLGRPTVAAIEKLDAAMAHDGNARQLYTRFYPVGAAPEFTAQTFDIYRCAIAHLTPSAFLTCFHGHPSPRNTGRFPDRKAAVRR